MNNVHSIFKVALAPVAPPQQPGLKPFSVSIRINGMRIEANSMHLLKAA
jgi:hypothetical protein